MRALVYTGAGDTGVIDLREVPRPVPGERQVRVRVAAAGLNRADIIQRRGHYPAPPGWPADIPGLEYAGEVEALGPGATRWRVGDRVMGLVGGGAQAEFVAVHEDEALPVPASMKLTDAAAIPEAFLTAWDALTTRGRLQAGERLLIHAVGSGVGTAAVQLGKLLGATVAGTSRTAAKLEQAKALGLDEPIDTGKTPWRLGASAFDVILDVLGGAAFEENLEALRPRGRLVLLGLLTGARAEARLDLILRKRLEVIGSVMRPRLLEERLPLVEEFGREVVPRFGGSALGAGRSAEGPALRPVVGTVVPMIEAARAHGLMERDEVFGKIVLVW